MRQNHGVQELELSWHDLLAQGRARSVLREIRKITMRKYAMSLIFLCNLSVTLQLGKLCFLAHTTSNTGQNMYWRFPEKKISTTNVVHGPIIPSWVAKSILSV